MRPSRAARWLRALALAALAGTATCDDLDNFDVEVTGQGVAPRGTVIDELLAALPLEGFDTIDLSRDIENQGATKENVDSVRITRFVLTIDDPAGATFDFVDAIRFYAETEGEPKVLIASSDPVPTGVTTLELTVEDDVELKPYAIAPSMRITSEIEGRRPDEDTTISATVVLDVDVSFGGC